MRTSSPIQVSIRRFVRWRVATTALAVAALGSIVAWFALATIPLAARVAVAGLCVTAIVHATRWLLLMPTRPTDLRWDGTRWLVARHGAPAQEAEPVDLDVALDLGGWMLLRLRAGAPGTRRRVVWLPVERAALGADWHPLRCAVHAWHAPPAATDIGALSR
jgi:hypothetical protein